MGLFIPSRAVGYAQYRGESKYPQDWEGLVGAWPAFLGPTGGLQGVTLRDMSGRGNHGEAAGNPQWVVGGKFGWAMDFDGTGDWITIANSESLTPTTACTLIASVKTDTIAAGVGGVCQKRHNSDGTTDPYGIEFGMFRYGDDIWGRIRTGSTVTTKAEDFLVVGKWFHTALVYDGANLTIYIDGVQKDSDVATGAMADSDLGWIIANRKTTNSDSELDGQIDNVLIYNRALTAAEIALHYRRPTRMFEKRGVIYAPVAAGIPIFRRRRECG